METLEQTLAEVERLRRNLFKEIVIQEGGVKEVEYYEPGYSLGVDSYVEERRGVEEVYTERITPPDTERREAAKEQLQQIYDSSEWYSARYIAGRILDIDVNDNLSKWIDEICNKLKLPKTKRVKIGEHTKTDYSPDYTFKHWYSVDYTVEDYKDEPIPENVEIINQAKEDISKLFKLSRSPKSRLSGSPQIVRLLKSRLYTHNKDRAVRIEAGKALSYSSLRIWLHEFFR